MRAIQLKLLRNLWQIKGQVLAITLVIMVGVSVMTYREGQPPIRLIDR